MLLALLQAAEAPASWADDVIAKATIVIAAATVLSLITTSLLWLTTRRSTNLTRDMFEAAHRPYIVVSSVELKESDPPGQSIGFEFEIDNVGSIPARDFTSDFKVSVDGTFLLMQEVEEDFPVVIYPTHPLTLGGPSTDDPREIKQIKEAANLSLIVKCSYKGVTKQTYTYEEKFTYDKSDGDFNTVRLTAD